MLKDFSLDWKTFKKYLPHLIVGLGIFLRIREYLYARSLWVDEAFLANEILRRGYLGLLQPLADNQHAPLGFLWAEKTLSLLFGGSEYTLRFIPLVAGLISLFLFKKLADRLFDKELLSVAALSVFSFSDLLIRYSGELKQYSLEVMVNLILLSMVFHLGLQKLKSNQFLILLATGIFSFLFSHTSILTLISIGIAGVISTLVKKKQAGLMQFILLTAAWLTFFGAIYLPDALQAYRNLDFIAEWRYFSLFPASLSQLTDNLDGFMIMLTELLGPISAWVGLILLPLGLFLAGRKNQTVTLLLILPFMLAIAASGLHKYPFVTRVFLFSMPLLIIFIIRGLGLVLKIKDQLAGLVLFVGLFLALSFYSFYIDFIQVFIPREIEAMKPVLDQLTLNKQPEDGLYVYYASGPAFDYYKKSYGLDSKPYIQGQTFREDIQGYLKELNQFHSSSPKHKLWLIFSHSHLVALPNRIMTEEQFITGYLDTIGEEMAQLHFIDSSLYEYYLP